VETLVTIDGFPYYAGTAGASAPASWEPAEDSPRGAALFADTLVSAKFTIEERLRLGEGDLEASGLTFALHDRDAEGGIAHGHPWLTWLSTRDPREVPSAVVAVSFDDAATSFFLDTASASAVSGSVPGVLWVDSEAILCASIDLGTGEVTVDTDGRGYYGSRAVSHLVDEEYSTYPEAWTAPPWATQRRVILWRVGDDGVARARWRGYAHRAPRTSQKSRAILELQCDHAWTVERSRPLGDRAASTRLRGYNAAGLVLRLTNPAAAWTAGTWASSWRYDEGYARVYDTLDELLTEARRKVAGSAAAQTGVTGVTVHASRQGRTLTMRARVAGISGSLTPAIQVLGELTSGNAGNGDPQRLEVSADAPEVAVVCDLGANGTGYSTLPVTTAAGLPTSALPTISQGFGPHRILVRQVLVGDYDDDARLVVAQPAASDFEAGYNGPVVTGFASLVARDTGLPQPARRGVVGLTGDAGSQTSTRVLTIDRAVHLGLATEVRASHWVHGLWGLLAYGERTGCRVDPRNWNLDDRVRVERATDGDLAARTWLFEGDKTLGEFLTPTLAAEGCVPVVREHGRVGVLAIGHPTLTATPVASFTSDDCVQRTGFEWSPVPEALTNVATVKVDETTVTTRDSRSVQRYGETQARGLDLAGLPPRTTGADPRSIASRVLSRLVQVWGDPVAVVRWQVPLGFADEVYLGDLVELTDSVVPNGAGGRGMTARRAIITARTEDDSAGAMAFEAVVFPHCYAYAPAIRVREISGAVLTADYDYVRAGSLDATDYAGTTTGSGGHRGVARFRAGDRGKLVLRDSTSYVYLSCVVQSVNAGAGTITLTASVPTSPDDWPLLAFSGLVDFIYDDFETAGIQAAQRDYAACGSGKAAFGSIGTSGLPSRRWAP
jgi:hypothetical protein